MIMRQIQLLQHSITLQIPGNRRQRLVADMITTQRDLAQSPQLATVVPESLEAIKQLDTPLITQVIVPERHLLDNIRCFATPCQDFSRSFDADQSMIVHEQVAVVAAGVNRCIDWLTG